MLVGPGQEQKAANFRTLHGGEPFVILNPCDAGSAKILAAPAHLREWLDDRG